MVCKSEPGFGSGSGSGSRKAKITHNKVKTFLCSEVLYFLFGGLEAYPASRKPFIEA
jgi:hypothetical protein